VNPNFDRALLAVNDTQPHDDQTVDSTDLSGQDHTEPYPGDRHAEPLPADVGYGGDTWNQASPADARYPPAGANWNVEYEGGGGG